MFVSIYNNIYNRADDPQTDQVGPLRESSPPWTLAILYGVKRVQKQNIWGTLGIYTEDSVYINVSIGVSCANVKYCIWYVHH